MVGDMRIDGDMARAEAGIVGWEWDHRCCGIPSRSLLSFLALTFFLPFFTSCQPRLITVKSHTSEKKQNEISVYTKLRTYMPSQPPATL
jgi:hypothetical protein